MKTAFACLSVAAMAATVVARPEPNAFLNTMAPSLPALIKQVQKDPQVYARYARHFGMNRAELVSYFSTLRPATIGKSGPYVVYNVHDDGIIRSRIFSLKAGSLIYVDVAGTPILKKICGNPMTVGPKRTTVASIIPVAPIGVPNDVRPVSEEETPTTVEEMTPIEEMEAPPFEAAPPEVTPPIVPETPPTITPPTITPTPPTVVSPGFETAGLGWLIPLLAGSVITTTGGGTSSSGLVPEPATLAGLLLLGGSFAATRLRKRR